MNQYKTFQVIQQYTLDEDEAPSRGVCSVVAALENCSPLDLTPLGKVTDPDALNALLVGTTGTSEVTFEYCGYEVTATPEEIRLHETNIGK